MSSHLLTQLCSLKGGKVAEDNDCLQVETFFWSSVEKLENFLVPLH